MADQRRSLCTWIKTTVNKFVISNYTALILRMCKTTLRSDRALSAIFCIIVYCCSLETETLVMLRIVCIPGNANYSQSEILHFKFFLWGSMPSDPLRDQKFISSLHACKISGPCRSPFFIPAELTALHYRHDMAVV